MTQPPDSLRALGLTRDDISPEQLAAFRPDPPPGSDPIDTLHHCAGWYWVWADYTADGELHDWPDDVLMAEAQRVAASSLLEAANVWIDRHAVLLSPSETPANQCGCRLHVRGLFGPHRLVTTVTLIADLTWTPSMSIRIPGGGNDRILPTGMTADEVDAASRENRAAHAERAEIWALEKKNAALEIEIANTATPLEGVH